MSEKSQIDRNQIWMMVMVVTPVVILMNLGSVFAPEGGLTQTLYSGLLGGVGGLIGSGGYILTKNRSTTMKIIGVIALLIVASALFLFGNTFQ